MSLCELSINILLSIISGLISGYAVAKYFDVLNQKKQDERIFNAYKQEREKYLEQLRTEVDIAFENKSTDELRRILDIPHTYTGWDIMVCQKDCKRLHEIGVLEEKLKQMAKDNTILGENRDKILSDLFQARIDILKMRYKRNI